MVDARKINILWVDDEIDLLKAHILYLVEKGFEVETANNGQDALAMVEEQHFDLIFLDENMPGLSGLEVLSKLKNLIPEVPVVMITKSEEENIMDQAIGSKISDYLIKPVNPTQILLTIKKHVDQHRLVAEKTTSSYQTEFGKIGLKINDSYSFADWAEVYKQLVYWEIELEDTKGEMDEVLKMQKTEANHAFVKFVKRNYIDWLNHADEHTPLMSHQLMKDVTLPLLEDGEKVVMLVIDNFRFDQWLMIKQEVLKSYRLEKEEIYSSILPTATQYARNSLFSGLMPAQIKEMYPEYWLDETSEGSKNQFEGELIGTFFKRFRQKINYSYQKVSNMESGKQLIDSYSNILNDDLSVVVFNFVDMLSHARTESKMIKELAYDESAYRSLSKSWFMHSVLKELLDRLENEKVKVIITTDHGTIRVKNPVKVIGDKETSTNLRYKQGRNLNYKSKEVFEITKPEEILLPKVNVSTSYIFATNEDFLAYPNNYNHYVSYYKDTFQHGGVSMEEMLIPYVLLSPKK
ncbi:Response regulator receiver domain-containing protein [Saccharicrinis carchari]|uniref:Response regulator receiver domain-containing protein n=1 Tax=Saccharicrinis carchari TaxID=1168039 RepID=A0A521DDJ7_SACCC|nr:bifunctional response regulator/alkaline phosphatase family protein [Saccharicrinis carchari]SMO69221.1 Response regulator receiver domain-containing protein [Saccharicrinis carchari]